MFVSILDRKQFANFNTYSVQRSSGGPLYGVSETELGHILHLRRPERIQGDVERRLRIVEREQLR